ncbi:hypothetical protein AVEN_174960-1, partial [Araneus ventricosus]
KWSLRLQNELCTSKEGACQFFSSRAEATDRGRCRSRVSPSMAVLVFKSQKTYIEGAAALESLQVCPFLSSKARGHG